MVDAAPAADLAAAAVVVACGVGGVLADVANAVVGAVAVGNNGNETIDLQAIPPLLLLLLLVLLFCSRCRRQCCRRRRRRPQTLLVHAPSHLRWLLLRM
jgi:hypothetical protein